MDFREVLEMQMQEKSISVHDIATAANCSKSYIYDLLKGTRRFNEELEKKICGYLEIEKIYVEKSAQPNSTS